MILLFYLHYLHIGGLLSSQIVHVFLIGVWREYYRPKRKEKKGKEKKRKKEGGVFLSEK